MNRLRVAVLSVLNQKNHQEGDNGGAGIDDQLPRVRIVESRSRHRPDDDDENGADEGPGAAENSRCLPGKDAKGIASATEKVPVVALSFPAVFIVPGHAP